MHVHACIYMYAVIRCVKHVTKMCSLYYTLDMNLYYEYIFADVKSTRAGSLFVCFVVTFVNNNVIDYSTVISP